MSDQLSRRAALASVTTAVLAGTAGCVASSRDVEEPISRTIDPGGASGVTVSGEAGSVEVVAESRDTIAVGGRKRAAAEDDLEDLDIDVDRSGDTVDVAVDRPDGILSIGAGPVADLEVAVPESLRVAAVDSGSGPIDVRDVRGPLEAAAGSGAIEIDGVDGAVTTETGSGAQTLSAVEGSLTAEAGSGAVTAAVRSLDGDSRLEAGSGSVSVTLPSSVDVALDVSTGSGDIVVDGSAVDRTETADDLDLTLGDGTHALVIETGSGDVEVTAGAE